MAFTLSDLAAVDAAIASGALTVRHQDGRMVTYRSMGELREAKKIITDDIAAQRPAATRARTGYFNFATSRERS